MPLYQTTTKGYTSYTWNPSPVETTVVDGIHNLLVSVNNNHGGQNPFEVKHTTVSGSRADGMSGGTTIYRAYPSGFYAYGMSAVGGKEVNAPDNRGNLFRHVEARTNPSRPDILLPVFLAELRDIPHMVKEVGHLAIAVRDRGRKALKDLDTRSLAQANLALQFGWLPFVQDLWKMATFQERVQKRMKELHSLSTGKGLRRRLKYVAMSSDGGNYTVSGDYRSPYSWKSVCQVSGGMSWRPTFSNTPLLSESQVRRVLTGMTPGAIAQDVWEALPWSWFTDYFYNVGEMLQAGNRTIATPLGGWIKYDWNTTLSHGSKKPEGATGYTLSEGIATQRHVLRYVDYPASSASFPTLGTSQLSILGSLAVVRNRKVLWH